MTISTWLSSLPEGSLKLLQITDTHIYGDKQQTLLGVDTLDSLKDMLSSAQTCHWPIDGILVTGDIVHDGSSLGYQKIADILNQLDLPVLCLPGNHDSHMLFHQHLNQNRLSTDTFHTLGNWNICMLDSAVAGKESGHINTGQLDALDQQLGNNSSQPALVCLHHQPIDIESLWIDHIGLHNKKQLWTVLNKHPQVKGIIWGHVHQQYDNIHNGIKLMATPSTCVQFSPKTDEFSVDLIPSGCRWLGLLPDGNIQTRVLRTEDMPEQLQIQSHGY